MEEAKPKSQTFSPPTKTLTYLLTCLVETVAQLHKGRPYKVKSSHDWLLGPPCMFTTELVETGVNPTKEFAFIDQ